MNSTFYATHRCALFGWKFMGNESYHDLVNNNQIKLYASQHSAYFNAYNDTVDTMYEDNECEDCKIVHCEHKKFQKITAITISLEELKLKYIDLIKDIKNLYEKYGCKYVEIYYDVIELLVSE